MRSALVIVLLLFAAPLRAAAWAPACLVEDALGDAAAQLLLEGAPVDATSLTRAARAAGSDAPVIHALVARLDEQARVQAWLAALRLRSDAPLVCGHARDATRILLLATARGGVLAAPSTEDATQLELTLAPTFFAPRLVVLDAQGTLYDVPIESGARHVTLPDEARRPLLVQLVATGPAGPRPVAERGVGGAPFVREPPQDAYGLTTLRERLRAARLAAHVPAVRDHRLLARAAIEQARAVCVSGRVAHLLAPGVSPEVRFAALGIRARFVGEAIGRAADLDAAWAALLASPSHRAALLDPRFTDAGLGTVSDERGRWCVVVALAAWPRFLPPAGVAQISR